MRYYEITDILDLEDEVWKTHPVYTEYEGSNYGRVRAKERYTVSNWGRGGRNVRSIERTWKPKIIKQHKAFNYLSVNIRHKSYFAHRFICECWHGLASGLQVDHINEDKFDNRPCNLRWVSGVENCRARDLPKRARAKRREHYPNNEWTDDMIHTRWKNQGGTIYVYVKGTKIIKIFEKKDDAGKYLNVDPTTISNRCKARTVDKNGGHWLIVKTIKS